MPQAQGIVIVTGAVGAGKTTRAGELITEYRSRGASVGGVLAEKRYGTFGEVTGYDFVAVDESDRWPYALRSPRAERAALSCGRRPDSRPWQGSRFTFLRDGFQKAEETLERSAGCDIVVVDEIGPLEMKGGGLWHATNRLLHESRASLLLVVRERIYLGVRRWIRAARPAAAVSEIRVNNFVDTPE